MQTVAETQNYAKLAEKLLTISERDRVIQTIAFNPLMGGIIKGTGGIRKIRIAKEGGGKSGGVRVIYYHYNCNIPIHLLAIFGKNEKSDLSAAERHSLSKFVAVLKKQFRQYEAE